VTADLNLDGPYSPEATLAAEQMVTDGITYLAYATRHLEAVPYPADAGALVGCLSGLVQGIIQVAGQAGARLEQQRAEGRIAGRPGGDVFDACRKLDEAVTDLVKAGPWLEAAMPGIGRMEPRKDGGNE
jgi:hypothetical protein